MCQYWSVFDIYIFIEECQSRKKMRCVAPKRPPWSCHSGAWKKNSWKLLAISWFSPFKIPKDKNLHSFGFFICPAACTWLLHRSSGWLITGSTSIMSCSSLPKMNLPGLSHTIWWKEICDWSLHFAAEGISPSAIRARAPRDYSDVLPRLMIKDTNE